MSRQIHIMIAALVTLAGAFSCANEDKKLTIADQEAAIDSYISQNYANNTVVRRNGSNRVILDRRLPIFLLCRICFHQIPVNTVQHQQPDCCRRKRIHPLRP